MELCSGHQLRMTASLRGVSTLLKMPYTVIFTPSALVLVWARPSLAANLNLCRTAAITSGEGLDAESRASLKRRAADNCSCIVGIPPVLERKKRWNEAKEFSRQLTYWM